MAGIPLSSNDLIVRRWSSVTVWRNAFYVWLLCSLCACSALQVSPYDAKAFADTEALAGDVMAFYGKMLELPLAERTYDKFSADYVSVEAKIRTMIVREKARPMNKESASISDDILTLWEKYHLRHREKNDYGDVLAKAHRNTMQRVFTAALKGEAAKKSDEKPQ